MILTSHRVAIPNTHVFTFEVIYICICNLINEQEQNEGGLSLLLFFLKDLHIIILTAANNHQAYCPVSIE